MSVPKRIVCYAINGSGLGHLTRLIAVARWLRRYAALLDGRPPEVIFLTSSDASDALARAGFAAFKIPSKTTAKSAELDKLEYRRLAKHFVWNTLGVFNPDLFIVDTFPSGSFDELFQVLDGPFKKGFIYRRVKSEFAARPTFRSALAMYDRIVCPHRRDPAGPAFATPLADAIHCGEVMQFEREELLDPQLARQQLGVSPHRRLVYLSAGGGGDPLAEATLFRLVDALRLRDDLHLLVGAGPLYRGERLASPNVTWFDAPAVWPYFSAVDAALCAAGYNTFHELIFARVPTAFFAQQKIADDQAQRISAAESVGACCRLPEGAQAQLIGDLLDDLLTEKKAASLRAASSHLLPDNGARRCAQELLKPLYELSALQWAASVLTPRLTLALERIGTGSTKILPDWLSPLMPAGPLASLSRHAGLDGILSRLSPAAAQEVTEVLADRDVALDQSDFEAKLVALLDAVGQCEQTDQRTALADDVLKTLLAVMKKQPLVAARNGNRLRWLGTIIEQVHKLMHREVGPLSTAEILQLFRMFPRIDDGEIGEVFELYLRYLEGRVGLGDATHEIMRQLQLLKIAHAKVTRDTIDTLCQGMNA